MKDDPLHDEDHVSRYCYPSWVQDNLPTVEAFRLRGEELYLSVNWIEYWGKGSIEDALSDIRGDIELTLKKDGRFVVLGVGDVRQSIEDVVGTKPPVTHQPTAKMKSHSAVFGLRAGESDIAVALMQLVVEESVFPALE